MVAEVDVGLPRADVFAAVNSVRDAVEQAEGLRPEFEEPVADVAEAVAQEEGDEDTREVEDHEKAEDNQDPGDVEFAGDVAEDRQGNELIPQRNKELGTCANFSHACPEPCRWACPEPCRRACPELSG